jgi:WD40-like Beta Propeller Repeat
MGPSYRLLSAAALAAGLVAAGIAAASNVAYTSLGASTSHVWVMEGDGTGKDQLTSGSVNDFGPVISPNGSRLVFVRRRTAP